MATFEVENGRLYQWDIGRTIKVSPISGEAIDEVHFAYGTDEDALRRELHDGKAEIPNVLLQRHGQMRVWAVVNDEDGRQTIQNAYLNVRERNKPEDYIYTDEEVRRYEELEARLDEETGKYNEVDERLDRLENDENYVISVNGKMGEVKLVAADVGAVESVNGEKGKVILSAEDVGALPVTNGNISIGKTTSTTSNSFSINRRYDSITTQTAKFGISGEELTMSIIEKATPASGGTYTTTGTISVSPRRTSFTIPLYFTSASVKGRTRENLDVYSKEEVDEAILEATKNNGDEEAVKILPQELSTDQQEQARNNIDVYSKTEVDNIIEEIEIDKAVESVNGKTGRVKLTANDVGAIPAEKPGTIKSTGVLIAGADLLHHARMEGGEGRAMFSMRDSDGNIINRISLRENETTLGQPLAVSSGGHGGRNAIEGRANLEVFSKDEIAEMLLQYLPLIGGNINGDLAVNGDTEQRKLLIRRKINNIQYTLQLCINYDGAAHLLVYKGDTEINRIRLAIDKTVFGQTINAPRYESTITDSSGRSVEAYCYPTSYGNLYMALQHDGNVKNAMTLTPDYTRFDVPVEINSGGTGVKTITDMREKFSLYSKEEVDALISEGEFELIETIMLEEELINIERTAEPNGNPLNLKALMVTSLTPAPTDISGYSQLYAGVGKNSMLVTCGSKYVGESQYSTRYMFLPKNGVWDIYGQYGSTTMNASITGQVNGSKIVTVKELPEIKYIRLYTFGNAFPVGTEFKIWGVRADA